MRQLSTLLAASILAISCAQATPSPTSTPPPAAASPGEGATPTPGAATATPTVATRFLIAQQAPCVCQVPFYVAMEEGFFAANGLQVEFIAEPSPLIGILTGEADMSLAAPTQAYLARARGQDVKILVTAQSRLTQALVVGPDVDVPEEGTWEEIAQSLTGHTIGITSRGGSIDVNLRYLLQQAGLDPDVDVELIPLGAGAPLIAGLEGGTVDALFSYQPPTATIVQMGIGEPVIELAEGEGPPALNQPMTQAIVDGLLVQDRPEVARAAADAVVEASRFMIDPANRDRVVEIAAIYLEGLDEGTLAALIDEAIQLQDPRFTQQQHGNVNQVLVDSGILSQPVSYEDVVAREFLVRDWP